MRIIFSISLFKLANGGKNFVIWLIVFIVTYTITVTYIGRKTNEQH